MGLVDRLYLYLWYIEIYFSERGAVVSTTSLSLSTKPDSILYSDMDREKSNSVESFETYRSYLFSIAYRMLGSAMDA
jgi:hypothetical protein